MSLGKRRIALECLIVALVICAAVLPGCDGQAPTPTAVSTLFPLSLNLVVNPDIRDVLAGQSVAITVEASGQDLLFEWSAARGQLSATDTPAVIYTAPDTPGVDTVTVYVTSASGTTTRSVRFNVKARPTIAITAPLDQVLCSLTEPCVFAVTGISSGVATEPNLKVVVFVNPEPGQADRWWPHPLFSVGSDGAWQGQAHIGSTPCWPAGDDFQIVALVLTADQANQLGTTFQFLPQEYVARSNTVDLVTAYSPMSIDLSPASVSSDDGSTAKISTTRTSLTMDYDLGTGGWVLVTVPVNQNLSCMKNLGASISFSLEGSGATNSFEVKVEDTDGTNYGWLSEPGASVTPRQTIEVSLGNLVRWWGGTDDTLNWQQVKNIMFAVSKKPGDAGGQGQVIVQDVALVP